MDNEAIIRQLQQVDDRSQRNEGRIKKLESENQVLHELAKSVAVMTEQLKTMNTNIHSLDEKVDDLESKPVSTAQATAIADAKKAGTDAQSALTTHKADITIHVTAAERTAWNAKLDSYTETDPTVPAWAKASSKPTYTAAEVGLGNVDNVKQYSASNPPPYPVTSVNGQTGAVTVAASKPTITTVTLTAANWNSSTLTQTVTVTGILTDETKQLIQCMPAPTSMSAITEAGAYCSGQGTNSLTFTCSTVPTSDVVFNIAFQDANCI